MRFGSSGHRKGRAAQKEDMELGERREGSGKMEDRKRDIAKERQGKYRHEFKYICSEAQLAILSVRLNGMM